MLILSIILLILLIGLGVFGFFYLQIKNKQRAHAGPPDASGKSITGICAKCKQERILVKQELSLCAFCWSSINTKQVG